MRKRSVAAIVLLSALIFPGGRAQSSQPPPRLSRDPTPVDVRSTYGSGHFGRWIVDGFGLPAFRYTIDQTSSAKAHNAEMANSTDAWHQIGNDHIVANAYNHGYVQLWSQDRLYQWMNFPEPDNRHYAGGFGYLRTKTGVVSTLWLDRLRGAKSEREFGIGYVRRATAIPGAEIEEFVYAPFGDDPVLVHDVTIRSTGTSTFSGSWFEYWDVNPSGQAQGHHRRGVLSPAYDAKTQTLTADQVPQLGDDDPLTIYASALRGTVTGFDTDVGAFFGSGSRDRPAAVTADKTTNSIAAPSTGSTPNNSMFAFRSPVTIPPGRSVTLRYAYGAAHRAQIAPVIARQRASSLGASERSWARWLPKISFGNVGSWLSRELQWDAYMVRSGATYEEECGHHILSQGGYYQYDNGFQGAFRDPLQHMMPMIYAYPNLAREVLRYSAQEQPSGSGVIPYALVSNCTRFDLGSSNDLDFWLLWAASEYALATRDFAFFDEKVPYSDGANAKLWDHLKLAFFHQENVIGRGPHGGYITGLTGDWSDFETEFQQMTESMLVTAQLAYAYPLLAQVADVRKDASFAKDLRAAGATNVATLKREWTGKGWFSRGYSGPNQFGKGSINSEPQPWALMAGAATPKQQKTVLKNVKRFLTGIGAPGGPSKIGSAQSPAADDPDVTEHQIAFFFSSANFVGNVWYALNGPLVWASAPIDQSFAWDELRRNTLAQHARAFPDHWDGTISVDDTCHAWYTDPPAQCGTGLSSAYYGQILHQPAWILFDAIKLAGILPTKSGYRIDPHVPSSSFSLRMPVVGVARGPRIMRGYVRPERSGKIVVDVVVPSGARSVAAWVNGKPTSSTMRGSVVRLVLTTSARVSTDWALTW